MPKTLRKTLVVLTAFTLLAVPFGTVGWAQDETEAERGPKPVSVAGDLILARPLGLAATIVGAAFFIIALPFAAMGGNVDEVTEALVKKPARYTFQRPLGHFSAGTRLTEPLEARDTPKNDEVLVSESFEKPGE